MRIPKTTAGAAALALSAVLVLSGCGDSGAAAGARTTSPSTPAPSPTPTSSSTVGDSGASQPANAAVITIKSYKYSGASTVPAGATVTVKNEDPVAHTVTADKGGFNVNVPADSTAKFTAPSKAGTYPYHCMYHSEMHGVLKVS